MINEKNLFMIIKFERMVIVIFNLLVLGNTIINLGKSKKNSN